MKTNEIRLGNYVIYNNEIIKLTHIEFGIIFGGGPSYMYTKDMQGVPLTKEILLKTGFTFTMECFIKDEIEIKLIDGIFCCVVERDGFSDKVVAKLPFVHQLQNLYFALTGKELEFK